MGLKQIGEDGSVGEMVHECVEASLNHGVDLLWFCNTTARPH